MTFIIYMLKYFRCFHLLLFNGLNLTFLFLFLSINLIYLFFLVFITRVSKFCLYRYL